MEVQKIEIRNILGIEALTIEPGGVTRVTGGNGTGKTSVLEAIKSVCKGGHDVTLLRNGQEKGEVALEFADGMKISRRVTQKGSYLKVTDQEGKVVPSPAAFLSQLWDALSANPVDFLTAKPKERLDWLLETVKIEGGVDKVAAASGLPLEGSDAFGALEQAAKTLTADRRDVNRSAREKRNTVDVIAKDLPDAGGDQAGQLRRARLRTKELRHQRQETRDQIRNLLAQEAGKLEADANAEIERIRKKLAADIADHRARADEALAELDADRNPEIEAATAEESRLEEVARQAERAAERRELKAQLEAEVAQLEQQSADYTERLKSLDKLKEEFLAVMPLPGLEIQDGEIRFEGVPFERLNTAAQWSIAIRLAKLRAGEIPIICADGLEALDNANFEAFAGMAEESGLHFVVTDRGEGPLAVDGSGRRKAEVPA